MDKPWKTKLERKCNPSTPPGRAEKKTKIKSLYPQVCVPSSTINRFLIGLEEFKITKVFQILDLSF